MAYHTVSR